MKLNLNFADDEVKKIIFHDEQITNLPAIELHMQNLDYFTKVFRMLVLCLRMNEESEEDKKLKCNLIVDKPRLCITLYGNVENAVRFLQTQALLSQEVCKKITDEDDDELQKFLKNSKNYAVEYTDDFTSTPPSPTLQLNITKKRKSVSPANDENQYQWFTRQNRPSTKQFSQEAQQIVSTIEKIPGLLERIKANPSVLDEIKTMVSSSAELK